MAIVSTYLTFARETEAAFNFYRGVFGTEYSTPISRFEDMPTQAGQPPIAEDERRLVMHVALPIIGGHLLMGSDCPDSMGVKLTLGNNMQISLSPDSRAEADRLFQALSEGGSVETAMQEMFWGDYFGSLTDPFGIRWMLNCSAKA